MKHIYGTLYASQTQSIGLLKGYTIFSRVANFIDGGDHFVLYIEICF